MSNPEKFVLAWSDVYQDRHGDEYRMFHVAVTDTEEGFHTDIYNCGSREKAINLAEKMAQDRNLPVEVDISP